MRNLLLSVSVLVLAGCETMDSGTASNQEALVVVMQAPAPAPEPVIQMVTGWDGSVYLSPSQVPAQSYQKALPQIPGYALSNGMVIEMITVESVRKYVLRDAGGQIVREFQNADEFSQYQINPYKRVSESAVSTFSADVDTASYSMVRPYVQRGERPPAQSVRIEEMINYFNYAYELPEDRSAPFKPNIAVTPSPWNQETKLVHIGIKGFDIPAKKRPPMNLVFLVDVSGSMSDDSKLPLLKKSLNLLVDKMGRDDQISIVTYSNNVELLLKPTRGSKKQKIRDAISPLTASGGTAGGAGLQLAYETAKDSFRRKGVNRVILATDGDFNVGISDPGELKSFIKEKRDDKIYLSVLGFGQGNLKDNKMQALAQNGNGNAGYIDSLREARKFFANDLAANNFTIADDVKIQVEFNPAKVGEYRLIGYETRALSREDFKNDKIDAGDVGAGHSVTAIYEITPKGAKTSFVDPLRYQGDTGVFGNADFNHEYAFVKLRYKLPGEKTSKELKRAVTKQDEFKAFEAAPGRVRWATAVAAYGLKLRGDGYMDELPWESVTQMASRAKGEDPFGYRSEFIELTRDARSISTVPPS